MYQLSSQKNGSRVFITLGPFGGVGGTPLSFGGDSPPIMGGVKPSLERIANLLLALKQGGTTPLAYRRETQRKLLNISAEKLPPFGL